MNKDSNPFGEKSSEKLDFTQIVFKQIQTVAMQQSNPSYYGNFVEGVKTLENITVHLHDKEYHEEISKLKSERNENKKKSSMPSKFSRGAELSDVDEAKIDYEFAGAKLRALMKMLSRTGIIGEKEAIFDE